MWKNVGQRIRILREKEGITLNAFAKKLGVSSGYLSQLETGKTETIPLSLLEKLQEELGIFSIDHGVEENTAAIFRFSKSRHRYEKLLALNPTAAEYLLKTFESGIEYFLRNTEMSY